jgi:hypothetical protein
LAWFFGLVFAVAAMVNFPVGNVYADSPDDGNAGEQLIGNDSSIETLDVGEPAEMSVEGSPVGGEVTSPAGDTTVCVSIPAAAFHSDGNYPDCFFFSFYSGYITTTLSSNCCVSTPVHVPEGAVIYQVWISAIDNSGSSNQSLRLFRVNKNTGTVDIMATVSTSGQSTSIRHFYDISIDNPTVVYPNYAYYIGTCLRPNINLYTVRVWYHPHTDATFKSIEIGD